MGDGVGGTVNGGKNGGYHLRMRRPVSHMHLHPLRPALVIALVKRAGPICTGPETNCLGCRYNIATKRSGCKYRPQRVRLKFSGSKSALAEVVVVVVLVVLQFNFAKINLARPTRVSRFREGTVPQREWRRRRGETRNSMEAPGCSNFPPHPMTGEGKTQPHQLMV
uniref:Uncharacterized protein n=1 Tax=Anopheles farauti TaxID=69004 RepID=A0A182Q5A4_9DIPT